MKQHYKTYDDPDAELAGWKRYPVTRAARPPVPAPGPEAAKISSIINVLPAGTVFEGTIHVHNLRPFELGGLLWALTLGCILDPSKPRFHAVGTAKSFGFGRARIEIVGDGDLRTNGGEPPPGLKETVAEFVTLMDRWSRERLGTPWAETDQVRALLAMASPAGPEAEKTLKHLVLSAGKGAPAKDEFREARKQGHVLPSPIGKRSPAAAKPVEAPIRRPAPAPPVAAAPRNDWFIEPGGWASWADEGCDVQVPDGVRRGQGGKVAVLLNGEPDRVDVAQLEPSAPPAGKGLSGPR